MSVSEAASGVVDESLESTEWAPGTNGFHLEPRCRICRNDQGADEGNDLLASGVSYAMVLRVEQYRQRACRAERRQSSCTTTAFRPRLIHGRGPARFGVPRGIHKYVLHDRAALAGRPGFSALQSGFVAIPFTVSGVIGTMQRVGSAIGIAVIGTVLFGSVQIDKPGPDAVAFGVRPRCNLRHGRERRPGRGGIWSRVWSASSIVGLPADAPQEQCASASTN